VIRHPSLCILCPIVALHSSVTDIYQSLILFISLIALILAILAFLHSCSFLGRDHLGAVAISPLLPYPHIPWRPTSFLSSASAYLDESSRIWSLEFPEAIKLKLIVEMLSYQYRHKELLEPWFKNWIIFLLSFIPFARFKSLRSSVCPEYIAKSKYCFCSQSAILVHLILSHLRIEHAPLTFDFNRGSGGHYATVAFVGSRSYIIDPNALPELKWDGVDLYRITRSADRLENIQSLYRNTLVLPPSLPFACDVVVGRINKSPASRLQLFKKVCAHLSSFIWFYFLAFYLYLRLLGPLYRSS
jgi:hypothetical protein